MKTFSDKKLYLLIPVLVGATLLVSVGFSPSGPSLGSQEAYAMTQSGDLILIDIRTPGEWKHTGIAAEARAIDMRQPQGTEGFVEQLLREVEGDISTPIGLICRTGNRSARMQQQLASQGFTQVYNVTGGMTGTLLSSGWLDLGLPVRPCQDC